LPKAIFSKAFCWKAKRLYWGINLKKLLKGVNYSKKNKERDWLGRVVCPGCGEAFNLDTELFEEGDSLECPECGAELVVARKGNKLTVVSSFEIEEDEEPLVKEESE